MSGALQAVFQNQRSFGPPAIGLLMKAGFMQVKLALLALQHII